MAIDHQVGMLEALSRRCRRPLSRSPSQAGTGSRQFIGVGFGCLLAMEQGVGDLVDAVVVPAGFVSLCMQYGAVVTAQRCAVDNDHPHPIQAAQRAGVED
ncbi:Uncharacterised protein [Mycobacterium tuberculosis]|uniref:Uncharacterized protein n=1 Tax=Mycobacterium tuberculosis TaxID=1773 RepID=A0A916LAR2_MYCTX|nr:Uncharacterised protein [Mycobacterium tuberculosis]